MVDDRGCRLGHGQAAPSRGIELVPRDFREFGYGSIGLRVYRTSRRPPRRPSRSLTMGFLTVLRLSVGLTAWIAGLSSWAAVLP